MPLARVKGRVLFIADDGRRYVPGSAPWRKFLNEARAAGQQPFETIVLDNNMWALNPATSGKGSRDPLVLIDTNGKASPPPAAPSAWRTSAARGTTSVQRRRMVAGAIVPAAAAAARTRTLSERLSATAAGCETCRPEDAGPLGRDGDARRRVAAA